jgi:hypothetical protein
MNKLTEQTLRITFAAFICVLMSAFIIVSSTDSYADYASAQKDRIKQQQAEDRYWRNQDKLYNMLELQEKESALEYRKERRDLDIQNRKDRSKPIPTKDYKNHPYTRKK